MTSAEGVDVVKLSFSSLTEEQNKLEHLSLTSVTFVCVAIILIL